MYVRKWREVPGIYSLYKEYDIYKAYSHKTVDLPYSLPSCYWIIMYSFQICSIRLIISVWSWCPDPLLYVCYVDRCLSFCTFFFWPLCCLFFFDIRILITALVSFGHCVVYSSLIYRFWLPLWYLLTIVSSALLRYTDSDYPFGIFWPLCSLVFFDIQILITPLLSCGHCVVSSCQKIPKR
jgi:hypothetical protein